MINHLVQDPVLTITGMTRKRLADYRNDGRPGVTYVNVDLRDRDALRSAVQKTRPDLIFHLAAAGVRDPFLPLPEALDHNLGGTINLLDAAFAGEGAPSVKKLIVCRTPGERTAMNHYAASKAAAWLMCRMFARLACGKRLAF